MERLKSQPQWWEKSSLEVTKYLVLVQVPGIEEGPDPALKLAHKITIKPEFISTNPWKKVVKITSDLTENGFSFLPSPSEDSVVLGRSDNVIEPEESHGIDVMKEIDRRKTETGEGSPVWTTNLPT